MGIKREDREDAIKIMADTLDDISVLNIENAHKIIQERA